jgi:hypothetical protein
MLFGQKQVVTTYTFETITADKITNQFSVLKRGFVV